MFELTVHFKHETRMYSSRMCTTRCCSYPQHALLPGGCTCTGGVPAQGGVPAGGGVSAQGYTCPGTSPPWTEFLTHATGNITLPQTSFAGGNYRNLAKISKKLRIKWNFELTIFELTVPDL